jgi:hypothetical protein
MVNKALRNYSRWFLAACCSFILTTCTKDSAEDFLEETNAGEKIQAELDKLVSNGDYTFYTEDFLQVDVTEEKYISQGISYNISSDLGFELITAMECTVLSPASCQTIGSSAHMKVKEEAVISFDKGLVLLGLHISLDQQQAELLKDLEPEPSGEIFLKLPQFLVLVTALDEEGAVINSVRAIPASATYAATRVDEQWNWINTSLLGQARGIKITVISPIAGINSILIDNLTFSEDFEESSNYFTIALIPDTQKYTEKAELNEIFDAQARYLADHFVTKNIVFASHLGDIVEHGDLEAEWIVADQAMQNMDGIVPYGIVIGNHDFQDEWENPQLGSPLFNKYFPESRFNAYAWWGGFSPDSLSSYQVFPTPLGEFLYLHLTVDAPPPTVQWAQQILNEHPGMPSLVTTHVYLRENGRIPAPYLSGIGGSTTWEGISADDLFETLIAPNNQIFMVTCGHVSAEFYQLSNNEHGNEVYELLQDYQNRENGGEGFLRLLQFYPGLNRVQAVTYSPWLKTYEMDEDSFFELGIEFAERLGMEM